MQLKDYKYYQKTSEGDCKSQLKDFINLYIKILKKVKKESASELDGVKINIKRTYPDEVYLTLVDEKDFPVKLTLTEKTEEYVIAPIPASQYLIVKIDTIVYNSDGLKCFIFCGFETKTIKSDFLISAEPERNFDAKAFVGVRNNITDSITIYPFVKYGILGYSNYKEAVSDLEYLYFNKLKGETLSASHYVHNGFEQNVGDNDFFEHSVIFQPFDDSTYNYQYCYKELMKYPFSK